MKNFGRLMYLAAALILLLTSCARDPISDPPLTGSEIGEDDGGSVSDGHDTQDGDDTQDGGETDGAPEDAYPGDGDSGGEDTVQPGEDAGETGGEETPDEGDEPGETEKKDEILLDPYGEPVPDGLVYKDIYSLYVFGEAPEEVVDVTASYIGGYKTGILVGLLKDSEGVIEILPAGSQKFIYARSGFDDVFRIEYIDTIEGEEKLDERVVRGWGYNRFPLTDDGEIYDIYYDPNKKDINHVDIRDIVVLYVRYGDSLPTYSSLYKGKGAEIIGYSLAVDAQNRTNGISDVHVGGDIWSGEPESHDLLINATTVVKDDDRYLLVINSFTCMPINGIPEEMKEKAVDITGWNEKTNPKTGGKFRSIVSYMYSIYVPLESNFLIYYDVYITEKVVAPLARDENGDYMIKLYTYSPLTGGEKPDLDMQWTDLEK